MWQICSQTVKNDKEGGLAEKSVNVIYKKPPRLDLKDGPTSVLMSWQPCSFWSMGLKTMRRRLALLLSPAAKLWEGKNYSVGKRERDIGKQYSQGRPM